MAISRNRRESPQCRMKSFSGRSRHPIWNDIDQYGKIKPINVGPQCRPLLTPFIFNSVERAAVDLLDLVYVGFVLE